MKKKSAQFHAFRGLVMFLMLVSIGCFSISIVRDIGTYVALNQNIRTNSQKKRPAGGEKESLETEKQIFPIRITRNLLLVESTW